ncbi:MAG: prepilin-type N-terminal cleavage/methylation domain-containing protein [Gammaproteobacteria bacterium]|jgi:prepilin-type N-terminal cleavage/methylation domain-containing protein
MYFSADIPLRMSRTMTAFAQTKYPLIGANRSSIRHSEPLSHRGALRFSKTFSFAGEAQMLIKAKSKGFTLVEMISVLAVIAILGSVAAPKIFSAIEDAKVSAYVVQINTLTSAIAKFQVDTGAWPRHIPSHAQERYHQLMVNSLDGTNPIPGWQGPYLEKEVTHYISNGAYQEVFLANNNDANWACDLDGDGTLDGQFIIYRSDGISGKIAEKISNIIDGDGGITTGDKDWKKAGKVRRYQGNSASILEVCLASI